MDYSIIFSTHKVVVMAYVALSVIRLVLFLATPLLFTKLRKILVIGDSVLGTIFLATGLFMALNNPALNGLLFSAKMIFVIIAMAFGIIGLKKNNKVLAILSVVSLVMAYGVAEMMGKKSIKKSTSIENTESNATINMALKGREIYNDNCALCHGNDGKLMLAGAHDLSISKLNKKEITSVIKNGRGSMKAYKMSDEEYSALSDYILSLRNQ